MDLTWDGGRLPHSVKLDLNSNCGIIRSSPGYLEFGKYISMASTSSPKMAKIVWNWITLK